MQTAIGVRLRSTHHIHVTRCYQHNVHRIWSSTTTATRIAKRGLADLLVASDTTAIVLSEQEIERAKKHPAYRAGVPRVLPVYAETNAHEGEVSISVKKAAWFSFMLTGATLGAYLTFDPSHILTDLSLFFITTGICVLFGHSLGMHRKFIHNSYSCPKPLEYLLVHLGTLMGIAGPIGMMKAHDFRDWAQRQPEGKCHPYYSQQRNFVTDSHWQMCCKISLKYPPVFYGEEESDRVYRFMEQYWMLHQLPWAILFYILGGWSWVVWGVCVRVVVGMYGHFLVGWFAHNTGFWSTMSWKVEGAAIQGQNVGGNRVMSKVLAIMTAGESYHNNHHAFPRSANLAQLPTEWDLGHAVLRGMEKMEMVWDVKTVKDLPPRPELCFMGER